jgi:hypothetical protein
VFSQRHLQRRGPSGTEAGRHMQMVADPLADAITKQFPDLFLTGMPS